MINFLPKKKKRKKRKIILGLIVIVLISWVFYIYNINVAISENPQSKEFTIESGWGSVKISQELKKAGLIRNSLVFQIYIWQKGISDKLQSGEYFLASD